MTFLGILRAYCFLSKLYDLGVSLRQKIRLDLCYRGEGFSGWQSQKNRSGIQDYIEKALKIVLREDTRIVGASRTDSGVHAEHQVAVFETERELDFAKLPISLNALLPNTIVILEALPVDANFHPIYSCKSKIYRYSFWQSRIITPFIRPYVYPIREDVDFDRIEGQLRVLIGTHNFKSFCASDSGARTMERTIFDLKLVRKGPLIEFWIHGDGFLKQMIRSIAGTLLCIGSKKLEESLEAIKDYKDRRRAGPTAPAKGLSLVRVFYHQGPGLDEVIQYKEGFFGLNRMN